MIRLKVTPVVGLPQFTGWSQVAESTSSVSSRLVSVFAVSGKHAGNVGRDISDKISDFYYYDVEQLHEFIKSLDEFSKSSDCKLFISCALINGGKSVFVTKGGSVFLKRGEKAGTILSSENDIKIVNGKYTDNDVFVLTTYQASQFLSEIEQKFIQGFDVDIIITSIVPGLHAQTDSSLSAIVFINKIPKNKDLPIDLQKNNLNNSNPKDSSKQASGFNLSFKKSDKEVPSENEQKFEISAQVSGFLKILFNWFSKLVKKFIKFVKTIKIKELLIFIKTVKKKGLSGINNKNLLKIVVAVVIFLIISSVASFIVIKDRREKQNISALIAPVQEKIIVAKDKLDDDPITSRDITLEAISSLEQLKKENKDSSAVYLIDQQLSQVSDFYNSISGKKELSELNVFYDLRLVKSDYIANVLDVKNGKMLALDSEKKQIINLDISTKKVNVIDFSDYEDVRDIAINDDNVFVLTDGIKSFSLKDSSNDDVKIKEVRQLGDSNRHATFVNAYDRFVYVLSVDKRNIYRYLKNEDGYSEPVGWIKSTTGLKYDEITSFSVDGDIWLSTVDGQIRKFASGREENFSIRGLNEKFSGIIKVFTNDSLDDLYVLDASNNRVVILSKEGEFKKEIKSVSLATVESIAVSKEQNKIFAVSGSIIYEIDLPK